MLYWVAATYKPKKKKDEEEELEQIILQPEVITAKSEQAAAMKITIKQAQEIGKYDQDRVNIFVRPFQASLQKLEAEAGTLKRLTEGLPAVEKNLNPIMAFIDIIKFHVGKPPQEDGS